MVISLYVTTDRLRLDAPSFYSVITLIVYFDPRACFVLRLTIRRVDVKKWKGRKERKGPQGNDGNGAGNAKIEYRTESLRTGYLKLSCASCGLGTEFLPRKFGMCHLSRCPE